MIDRGKQALVALALMSVATACASNEEQTVIDAAATIVETPPQLLQAPLETALRARQHGELICHYHHPGALYDVAVTPLRVTTILFQADERVMTIGAGDTERFEVELSESDGKPALLVKPIRGGIRTNLSVVTDRRVYLLNLIARRANDYVVAFEPYTADRIEGEPIASPWLATPQRRPDPLAPDPLAEVEALLEGA